ncbi:SigE family RNA polymerase sigma factor [Microlunatus antarcticus]|uniref:RNA polymerase sigma factor n=1 Tax=Microlunatus antarcticus TaxID=53388 RepID=UPI002FCD32D6
MQRFDSPKRLQGVDQAGEAAAVAQDRGPVATARPRRGPPEAATSFDEWVGSAAEELLRFARVTTGDDPADLVQDALVAVFTRWSTLDAASAVAYAKRVIVNGHVSRWRRWRRRVVPVGLSEPETAAGTPLPAEDVLVARQLLDGLPVRQRAAVFLRFYDDLSYRDIADILGCREATARSYIHRALQQLKQHLETESHR